MPLSVQRYRQIATVTLISLTLIYLLYYASSSSGLSETEAVYELKNNLKLLLPNTCNGESNWPKIEIALPVPPLQKGFYETMRLLLPSIRLFWPWKRSGTILRILSDGEYPDEVDFASNLTEKLARRFDLVDHTYINFTYLPEWMTFGRGGHDRQQWMQFWATNFTRPETEYIAFLDSDTMFTSRVYESDIFENSKPIVRPLFGKPRNMVHWGKAPLQSYRTVGKKEPFGCMSYFPLIFKADHFFKMREHIRKNMNCSTFDEAFTLIAKDSQDNRYSQFHIMCTYIWWYHRSEYSWQIWQRNPEWKNPGVPGQVETLEEAEISTDLIRRTPYIAFHWMYEGMLKKEGSYKEVLKTGVCYSLKDDDVRRPPYCNEMVPDRLKIPNKFQWQFGKFRFDYDWNYTLSQHRKWISRLDACYDLDWNIDEVPTVSELLQDD